MAARQASSPTGDRLAARHQYAKWGGRLQARQHVTGTLRLPLFDFHLSTNRTASDELPVHLFVMGRIAGRPSRLAAAANPLDEVLFPQPGNGEHIARRQPARRHAADRRKADGIRTPGGPLHRHSKEDTLKTGG